MNKKIVNIVMTITILLLCASSIGVGYYFGVEEGIEQGTQEGAIYGANLVAYNLCVDEKQFNCEDGKLCGCFNVGGEPSGETE